MHNIIYHYKLYPKSFHEDEVNVGKEQTKSIVIVHLWQKNVLESSKAQYTLCKEKSTN